MNRTLAVLRVQALDHAQVYWPWAVMASSFVINVMLWIGLTNVPGYDKTTGGLSALYITAGVVAATGMYQKLPFFLGLGAARRTVLLGTLAYGVVFSAVTGVVLLLLNRLEAATGGYGVGGSFFRIAWWTEVPTFQLIPVYAAPMLLVLAVGVLLGGVSLRFGRGGLFAFLIAASLLATILALVLTWVHAWGAIGSRLAGLTPITLTAWLVLGTVAAAAVSWLALRRTPV
jgi:hypothetical protein